MKIPRSAVKALSVLLAGFILAAAPGPASAISIPEEKKLADKFMEQIHNQGRLLDDPVVLHFIRTLGKDLASKLPPQPFDFTFYLIYDKTFNAFAGPGANIFIHTGLLTSLNSTHELAGILAHEIAHAASRHVSQSIDRAQLVSIGSMAGVLAGVLLGSTGSGEAGQALTVGSLAAGQSNMLAFTRENETEADQKAVLYLRKTCYDPNGLLDSLTEMREADYQGVEGIPDYFKTHPGTGNRIAHLSALLADQDAVDPLPACPKTTDYNMIKYRVLALYTTTKTARKKMETLLAESPGDPALLYGLGLAYTRINRREAAIAHLQEALVQQPGDPAIQMALGGVYAVDGQYRQARELLMPLTDDPVLGPAAVYSLARVKMDTGDIAGAQADFTRLVATHAKTFPRAYYHLADLMSRQGQTGASHYYLGVYYHEIRDLENARRQLKKSLETLTDETLRKDAEKRLGKGDPKKKRKTR